MAGGGGGTEWRVWSCRRYDGIPIWPVDDADDDEEPVDSAGGMWL
jgi:hypothetical protein